jgi:hypothetical protein
MKGKFLPDLKRIYDMSSDHLSWMQYGVYKEWLGHNVTTITK